MKKKEKKEEKSYKSINTYKPSGKFIYNDIFK